MVGADAVSETVATRTAAPLSASKFNSDFISASLKTLHLDRCVQKAVTIGLYKHLQKRGASLPSWKQFGGIGRGEPERGAQALRFGQAQHGKHGTQQGRAFVRPKFRDGPRGAILTLVEKAVHPARPPRSR